MASAEEFSGQQTVAQEAPEVGIEIARLPLKIELGGSAIGALSLGQDPESAGIRLLMAEARRHDQELMAA